MKQYMLQKKYLRVFVSSGLEFAAVPVFKINERNIQKRFIKVQVQDKETKAN